MKKHSRLWKLAGKIVSVVLIAAVLTGLYFTLVIAQPQGDAREPAPSQPLLTASPARQISSEGDLRDLVREFPAPVMSFMSGSGMVFVSASSEDAPYEGQYGRIMTLYWQTQEGEPLILQSIYPAEALSLMGKGDYSFSGAPGPTLFGQNAVRMEDRDTIRLHAQVEGTGLYVLTLPKSLSASLSNISRSIQLFTAE